MNLLSSALLQCNGLGVVPPAIDRGESAATSSSLSGTVARTSFEDIIKLRAQLASGGANSVSTGDSSHSHSSSRSAADDSIYARSHEAVGLMGETHGLRSRMHMHSTSATGAAASAQNSYDRVGSFGSNSSDSFGARFNAGNGLVSANGSRQGVQRATGRPPLGVLQSLINSSALLTSMQEYATVRLCAALSIPMPGRGVQFAAQLPVQAFPPMCATSIVHAIQSMSSLLVLALQEDSTGFTQQSVCQVVRAFLSLEMVLSTYCGTLQASQYIRLTSHGRTQQIKYKVRTHSAVPLSVRALQAAVQEGLQQVLRNYRDMLSLVVSNYNSAAASVLFSPQFIAILDRKLAEL
jgi:hypothetical protein